MARIRTNPTIVKKNLETLAKWRSKKDVMSEMDRTIRSDILYLTVKHLIKVEKAPTHQLAQIMDQYGFISANTAYKYEIYIHIINERYDLPLTISQGWIYLDPDYKISTKPHEERRRSRLEDKSKRAA